MSDGIGLAEAMLGLEGFRVLEASESDVELVLVVETTMDLVGCIECGQRAEAQDRVPVQVRDLACFGRPARLVWNKRRWRCRGPRLQDQDVDRAVRRGVVTRRDDISSRRGSVPPGR